MRTIKFRGRHLCGQWYYGNLIVRETDSPVPETPKTYKCVMIGEVEDGSAEDVEEETVGQFTGLLDKNNKEIYEGDIIKFTKWDGKLVTGLVKWDDCNPCMCIEFKTEYKQTDWEYDFIKCGTMIIEVIGNIYDNPELIKGNNNE